MPPLRIVLHVGVVTSGRETEVLLGNSINEGIRENHVHAEQGD